MRRSALVCITGLFLLQGAIAGDIAWTGAAEVGYDATNLSHVNGHNYGTNGSALLSLTDFGFAIQFDGHGAYAEIGGISARQWGGGGSLVWRSDVGAFGFSGAFDSRNGDGVTSGLVPMGYLLDFDAAQYGAYGEWFALPDVTLRGRAGAITLNNSAHSIDATDWFGGVGVAYYVLPDLRWSGQFDYLAAHSSFARFGTAIEYLLSREFPLSLVAGYEYTDGNLIRAGGTANSFMIHLKYRFGTAGALRDQDRSGPLGWEGLYLSPGSVGRGLSVSLLPRLGGVQCGPDGIYHAPGGGIIVC